MSKLKVYVKNKQNIVKIPVGIRLLIRRCCQAVLATERFEQDAEVSVSFVSNTETRIRKPTFFLFRLQARTAKRKSMLKPVLYF